MKKILLVILFPFLGISQTQIGEDINGEAPGDESGSNVSISADGSVVAIGAWFNDGNGTDSGHVRVYQNIGGTWTQIGEDINGEAPGDISGYRISLSADGSVVAIGAHGNDGNGTNSGHVRVYQNIGGTWTQIGADINGEAPGDESGISVSLSADGNVVAIGTPFNNANGSDSGHVRVYQNLAGTWIQIGTDIDGEATGDWSGISVSLSADGNIVAIGARLNDGNGTNSGHVRVYQNIGGTWTQIGADINGEAPGDESGYSVSLAADGSIVAIGAHLNDGNGLNSGHVRIYQNVAGTWTQIGTDIDGETADDQSGYNVSLSADGNIVAIGARFNDENGLNSGHVRVYQNVAGTWTQIGTDINGEAPDDQSGNSVSLAANGSVVAIGAWHNDGNVINSGHGHIRIYDLNAILASNSFVQSYFSIYPNPSNDIVNISLENNLQLEKVNFYNQLGQQVKTVTTNVISTLELPIGNYYVEVITNQGKATKQLVVK